MDAGRKAARQTLQHRVPDLMAVAVVEALEVICIDDQQGERLARARRSHGGPHESLLERAAVRQPRQRVRQRQLGEFRLYRFTAAQLTPEQERQRDREAAQHQHDPADDERLHPPLGLDVVRREGDVQDHRQVADAREAVRAFDAVADRGVDEAAAVLAQKALKGRGLGDVRPDIPLDEGVAHDPRAIVQIQVDRPVPAEVDLAEQTREVGQVQGAQDHPAERTVRLVDAAAQHDHAAAEQT